MTISIGDKVIINDNYFMQVPEDPYELTELIRGQATVLEVELGLITVQFDNGIEWDKGRNDWRFSPDEMDKL